MVDAIRQVILLNKEMLSYTSAPRNKDEPCGKEEGGCVGSFTPLHPDYSSKFNNAFFLSNKKSLIHNIYSPTNILTASIKEGTVYVYRIYCIIRILQNLFWLCEDFHLARSVVYNSCEARTFLRVLPPPWTDFAHFSIESGSSQMRYLSVWGL